MKFLVVDDHALIREAMAGVLATLRDGAQVLQAADGAQAMALMAAQPDVDLVLLDLDLPDRHGLVVLDEIAMRHPAVGVVMLSGSRDAESIQQALRRGAQGFIPKTETRDVLTRALELVLAGGNYVPMAALGASAPSPPAATVNPQSPPAAPATAAPEMPGPVGPSPEELGLTGRQLDVLALLMQGRNNKLICRALGLAEPTVKNHVSAILRALGVTSRTEAVLEVSRRGWTLPTASMPAPQADPPGGRTAPPSARPAD